MALSDKPTVEEIVAAIKEVDVAEFIKALPTEKGGVYQTIYQKAITAATGSEREKVEAAESRATTAEEKVAGLEEQITSLKGQQPDLAARDAEWQAKLDKKERDHAAALADRDARLEDALYGTAEKDLVAKLVGLGMKPTPARNYARDVLVGEDGKRGSGRIRFGKDGKSTVTSSRESAIPIDIRGDGGPIDALADEIFGSADPEEKTLRTPPGPGARDRQPGAPPQNGQKTVFEQAREDVREKDAKRAERGGWRDRVPSRGRTAGAKS